MSIDQILKSKHSFSSSLLFLTFDGGNCKPDKFTKQKIQLIAGFFCFETRINILRDFPLSLQFQLKHLAAAQQFEMHSVLDRVLKDKIPDKNSIHITHMLDVL
ncbi:hypothetical protein [Enterococcus casseliflavus]|uniref:hypothetical protein n=1 Tax=Enterococcus casseliflavus TaxID=37734 RepID=UPI001BCE84B4|nr:hypothetical protein [Enterococcus casseliflavus]